MITATKDYNPEYQITPHFKMKELASPDGYVIWNNAVAAFANAFESFRNWYNREINPSSWFRTKKHNKKIKGASNSMHLPALAVDIPYPEEYFDFTQQRKEEFQHNIARKWREICLQYGVAGSLEICDLHFHIDFRQWEDGQFHIYYGKSV